MSAAAPFPFAAADLHIVLIAPEIHWNTGNAGRTCLALGAQLHLVHPLGFSLAASQLRRAGLDYWPAVAPVLWDDWETLDRALPGADPEPTAGDPPPPWLLSAEGERPLWGARFRAPTVLLFGRESRGLPQRLRERRRDRLLRIPMAGAAPGAMAGAAPGAMAGAAPGAMAGAAPGAMAGAAVRSLNLSSAVAVAAYEVRRQLSLAAGSLCSAACR